MKLSAALLIHHIKKKHDVHLDPWYFIEPYIEYPVLYHAGMKLESKRVYVIRPEEFDLPQVLPANSLYVLAGDDLHLTHDFYRNICTVLDQTDPDKIMEELTKIFLLYTQWAEKLSSMTLSGSSIQKMLEYSDVVISNSIMLMGMDFQVIAHKPETGPALSNLILGSTKDTMSLINSLKNDENYANATERDSFFLYPGNEIALPSLCMNIKKYGKTFYRVMILPGDVPMDDTFGFILEYLTEMIDFALNHRIVPASSEENTLHNIFSRILTDPQADVVNVSVELEKNGWSTMHRYICVLIRTGDLDWKNLTHRSICTYLENCISDCCALEHKGNVVAFINIKDQAEPGNSAYEVIRNFVEESQLMCGYSRIMHGHLNLHRQFMQAEIAIRVGSRRHPERRIHTFDENALDYIQREATRKIPGYMICHNGLIGLRYADDREHTKLYETLRCYLENNQNATRASAALFIHRSTLLYRLEKIQSILGSDLSDPEEVLYLLLSYRIMDAE